MPAAKAAWYAMPGSEYEAASCATSELGRAHWQAHIECHSRPQIEWQAELARERTEQRGKAIEAAAIIWAATVSDRTSGSPVAYQFAREQARLVADGKAPIGRGDECALAVLRALGVVGALL